MGKTDTVLRLFSGSPSSHQEVAVDAEIINGDAMQVYRGLDIGTAKPSPSDRARLPHHLLDIRDPSEQYDVGSFVRDAEQLIREIAGRGKLPIVTGGTGYYLKHLLYGLPSSPPSDDRVRGAIDAHIDRVGLGELYRELRLRDPAYAARVGSSDRQRIVRALEVWAVSGRPLSTFAVVDRPRDGLRYGALILERERAQLYARIDARVDAMFADGLAAEVAALRRAGYGPTSPGMRALGYREFFLGIPDSELPGVIAQNTRRYAKRQMTFFRGLKGVDRLPADDETSIRRYVTSFVEQWYPAGGS